MKTSAQLARGGGRKHLLGLPLLVAVAGESSRGSEFRSPPDHREQITDNVAAGAPDNGEQIPDNRAASGAFTIMELLVVTGIIALLLVLVVPAFTSIKSAGDVTSAAYTIKGVLDTARSYAMANNTYVWVGFYEEDVSTASKNPATPGVGRVVMSIVASKDGTIIYDPNSLATIDATKLIQVGKLTKIDNVHLATFTNGSGTGSTFDARAPVTYRIGDGATPPDSLTPFQYPVGTAALQYKFLKAVQFSPGGEARIDNNSYSLQTAAEIGVEPTHGSVAPTSIPANAVAVQFTGVSGNVKIYRR